MSSENIFLEKLDFQDKKEISLKDLGSRKKLKCFYLLCNDENILLFCSFGKSRILRKDIDELEKLSIKFNEKFNEKFTKKIFMFTSAICSKALKEGEKIGWKIVHVSM